MKIPVEEATQIVSNATSKVRTEPTFSKKADAKDAKIK